jgi:hypothetical protein
MSERNRAVLHRRAYKFAQGKNVTLYLDGQLVSHLDTLGAQANMSRSELAETLLRRGLIDFHPPGVRGK